MLHLRSAVVALAVAASLIAVSPASAATEVGSNCLATNGAAGYTFVQIAKVSDAMPIAAPANGVVTKWKVNSAIEATLGQKLQILRPTGAPNQFLTVAESTSGAVVKGQNSFNTRIPIQAGDRPGIAGAAGSGPPAPLYCSTGNPADQFGVYSPETSVGSTNTFGPASGAIAAVSMVVEPDADGDGYGDETQDQCPQAASVQAACPPITLTTTGIARKGFVQILVGASSSASVSVSGTVNVPKKRKKGKAGKSAIVRINGGTQLLSPGLIATFTMILPQSVKAALARLPRKSALTLTATASATDVAGRPSSSSVKVKLRGTKKPKGKAKGQG